MGICKMSMEDFLVTSWTLMIRFCEYFDVSMELWSCCMCIFMSFPFTCRYLLPFLIEGVAPRYWHWLVATSRPDLMYFDPLVECLSKQSTFRVSKG